MCTGLNSMEIPTSRGKNLLVIKQGIIFSNLRGKGSYYFEIRGPIISSALKLEKYGEKHGRQLGCCAYVFFPSIFLSFASHSLTPSDSRRRQLLIESSSCFSRTIESSQPAKSIRGWLEKVGFNKGEKKYEMEKENTMSEHCIVNVWEVSCCSPIEIEKKNIYREVVQ